MLEHGRPLRVLVAEPAAGGHHFNAYVRYAVRAMRARDWHVDLLTTASALVHPAYAFLHNEFGSDLACHRMPEISRGAGRRLSQARRQLAFWRALKRGFRDCRREVRPDCVLITTMDGVDKAIALLGSPFGVTPLFGISIGLSHHWAEAGLRDVRSKDRLNGMAFRKLLGNESVRGVMSIDPTLLECSRGLSESARAKVFHVPDPGEVVPADRQRARQELGIDEGEFIILVYGEISLRKSIEGLADAWLALPADLRDRVRLVYAGEWRNDARQAMQAGRFEPVEKARKLTIVEGYADQVTESRVFAAADAVWCAYSPEFLKPSAVLSQAASVGIPVIGGCRGLIGRIVKMHGLGPRVDPADANGCARTVARLVEDHETYVQFCRNSKEYGVTCSAKAFGDSVCAALQKGLGSSRPDSIRANV